MPFRLDRDYLLDVKPQALSEAQMRQAIQFLSGDAHIGITPQKAKVMTQFIRLQHYLKGDHSAYLNSSDAELYKQTIYTILSCSHTIQPHIELVQSVAIPSGQALYLPLYIRTAMLCRYNRLLLYFAKLRIYGLNTDEVVSQLIAVYVQIEKISDLEKAASIEIDLALRSLQQKKYLELYRTEKAEKIDDLFEDELEQNEALVQPIQESSSNFIGQFYQYVAEARGKTKGRRLKDNLAVLELKEDATDAPIYRQAMDQLTMAAMRYEDENETRLSKRKMKELKKGIAKGIEDGLLERDLLSGIGELGSNKKDE